IGDHAALNDLVRKNDWNQYTVIARGGTFLHIVNGQLMAAMVDDDPQSLNNQAGLVGIEIEATTKGSARNLWLKKLNGAPGQAYLISLPACLPGQQIAHIHYRPCGAAAT